MSGIKLGIYDLNTSAQTTETQIPDKIQSSQSFTRVHTSASIEVKTREIASYKMTPFLWDE